MNKKTLIKNAYIITSDKNNSLIENGFIVFDENSIIDLGTVKDKSYETYENNAYIIDAKGAIVSAGFINTHQHLSMSLLRSGREAEENRLFTYFFPFEKEILNEDIVYDATRISAWETLLGGVTTAVDMYYFEDKVIEASIDLGLRIVAGETIMSDATPSFKTSREALEYMIRIIEKYKNDKRVIPIVAPHSPYMCDGKTLEKAYEFSEKYNLNITMHTSEFENELNLIEKRTGVKPRSSTDYIDSLGILSSKWLLAHMIFADERDIKKIADKKANVAHCPVANAKSGKGIARAYDMIASSINVGLGTDGPLSGNRMDFSHVIGTAYALQKLLKRNATILKPSEVLSMATLKGAKAIGLDDKIGSLEKGKYADIVLWREDTPSMCAPQDYVANLVLASTSKDVKNVWVGGKLCVKDGELISTDKNDIIKRAKIRQREISCKLSNFN